MQANLSEYKEAHAADRLEFERLSRRVAEHDIPELAEATRNKAAKLDRVEAACAWLRTTGFAGTAGLSPDMILNWAEEYGWKEPEASR